MASYTDNNYGCKWKPRKVSAKRDFPDAFYEGTNVSSGNKLSKKHKVCESQEGSYKGHMGPEEGSADKGVLDFIPLETETETESVFSESCGSGTRGSGYDIIPRIVNAERSGSGGEIGKSGAYTELRIHGVRVKEIRWYETEDGLKIELSVDKLQKNRIDDDDELFGKDSRTDESVTERECVKRYEQIRSCRRRVAAVRDYPPGCGPVMKM